MKKLSILLCLLILFAFIPTSSAFAAEEFSEYDGVDVAQILESFTVEFPNREAGTDKEKLAAYFIAEQFLFSDLEGNPTELDSEFLKHTFDEGVLEEIYFQSFKYTFDKVDYSSQNVIGIKKSKKENAKNVIIGAHYDNVFALNDGDFSGASDNGSGVATMLAIMHNIKDIEFDFDITFIAFGAEEKGLFGSLAYVKKLSSAAKDNILLMYNLDVVAAGKKVFLYCDEVTRDYEKFLLQNKGGADIVSLPRNKKVEVMPLGKFPYRHTAFFSDNLAFMMENVKTAFFYAGDYDGYLFSERAGKPNFMHTQEDYFDSLAENFPQYESFMQQIAMSIENALTNADFESVMLNDKGGNYDLLINRNFNFVLMFFVLLGFAAFYMYMLKRKPPVIASPYFDPEIKKKSVFGDDYENK